MTMNDVIILLGKNYTRALTLKFVRKPLSYALFQTWHEVDRKEKERHEQR